MVKIAHLVAIAGGCGIGLGCMVLLLRQQTERFANQAVFIQSALNIMEDQPAVKTLLGNSYQVGRATLKDGFTKVDRLNVRVRLPIKGDNDTAQLYAYAKKRYEKDKFKLIKLEMTFEKVRGKKLVLLDLDAPDPLDDLLKTDGLSAENSKSDSPKKSTSDNKTNNNIVATTKT